MQLPNLKVIISGGGTGGHIFPAIAIADELKAINPNIEILFVGALGRMEMEKVPAAGYPIEGLWISGLQRKLTWKNISFPFKLIHSSLTARRIIKKYKPHIVIGVGGFASGPTVRTAASMGIPIILQEQNSFPGITNKLLAKKAKQICVAYPGMEKYFPASKIQITGNPVRKDIKNASSLKDEALKYFNLTTEKPIIFSVGGSLGALTLNRTIHQGLKEINDAGLQIIWQTGNNYFPLADQLVRNLSLHNVYVKPFIQRMDLAYAAADIVISRAGALSISELSLTGKPSILVPSPNVAEDHQTRNAMSLVSTDAAILVPDAEAQSKLIPITIELASDTERMSKLSENIMKLAYPDAGRTIANIIINSANTKPSQLL